MSELNKNDQQFAGEDEGKVQYQARHYEDQEADYRNYIEDTNLLNLIGIVQNGDFPDNQSVSLGTASNLTVSAVKQFYGIDVSGYQVKIEARQIKHIIERHGANGFADHSMSDVLDIAKMPYAIDNADSIIPSGESHAYMEYRDGKNRPSKTILYEKDIGEKSYYVVEAVPNTKKKTLFIVTAFIGEKGYKKEPQQFTNANGPDATTKIAAAGSSDYIVHDNTDSVKVQNQARTDTLTDREILTMAAGDIQVDNLDAAEADALKIFRERLDKLDSLQEERRELGSTYKEQQFGKKVDRAQAAETLKKMYSLDARIQEAETKVLNAETAPALRKVLPRARRIVEQQQKAKDDVALRRWRDHRNNAATIKKYRERITKNVTDISNWIISPSNKTDLKHVPDALKNTVIPFITSIDFTSKRQLRGGDATSADVKFMERLKALRAAMQDNITENGLYSGYNDLPPDFTEQLRHFIDSTQEIVNHSNGQFVINQMTAQELKELSDIVTTLKKHIQDFNRFHANAVFRHVYEAGDATISELGAYLDAKSRSKPGEAMNNFVFWQQIRPAYAFERFGSGGKAIYDVLRRGQARLAFNAKEIVDFAKAAYTAKEVKEWEETVKSIQIGDETVRMNVSQIMSFYELLKREQARGHIFGQGIRVASFRNGKEQITNVGQRITEEDADRIIAALTPRQIEVADKLQQFMQEKGGEWGNFVSMKRFGEKLFGEEHYFPINSDGRHLDADAGNEEEKGKNLYALLNMGFTKQLQEKANNRIVLYSIFDVFSNHMASMAQHNSFALSILDALKWFNYQQKEDVTVMENGSERVIHQVKDSVRDQLDRVYGVPEETRPGSGKRGYAENFIIGILKAFNGTETQGISSDSTGLNALRNYNMAQVAFNLRVVVRQPMAIIRAAMIIDYASIIRGMRLSPKAIQQNINEMQEHSGIAAWKDLGFYDTNISRGLTDIIKHKETFRDKLGEIGMMGAEKADQLTWAAMWSACKEEVQRKHDIRPGDKHFFEAVSSLFEEVVYKTQVVDSVSNLNFISIKSF